MKLLTLIAVLLLSSFTFGQNNYEVFDLTNQVHVKQRNSNTWTLAKKGMTLGFLDSINIHNNSEIRILDIRSNEVYQSSTCGLYRVKEIRDSAKKQSANILSAMYAQLTQQSEKQPAMRMVGATTRGENDNNLTTFAYAIIAMAKNIQSGTHSFSNNISLHAHQINGQILFSIQNHTSNNYCVNVVMCDFQKQKASLCYAINPTLCDKPYITLLPHQTIELTAWKFAPATPTQQYFLIATEQAYETEQLQHILTRAPWDTIDTTSSFTHDHSILSATITTPK